MNNHGEFFSEVKHLYESRFPLVCSASVNFYNAFVVKGRERISIRFSKSCKNEFANMSWLRIIKLKTSVPRSNVPANAKITMMWHILIITLVSQSEKVVSYRDAKYEGDGVVGEAASHHWWYKGPPCVIWHDTLCIKYPLSKTTIIWLMVPKQQ